MPAETATASDGLAPAAAPAARGGGTAKVVLEVRELCTSFFLRNGELKAVDRVSFTLHRGETLCIVGESGSGKSVTARSILQIVTAPGRVTGGRILLHRAEGGAAAAVDLAALDPRGAAIRAIRGKEIAMVFQEPMSSLSPVHTIGAQIDEMLRLHTALDRKARRRRILELLARVEIPEPEVTIDRYPFEYSGGMRQRAMIAMALACNPSILIADEPTTALDVTTQAEILDLIKELQRESGMAVIFITHDMGVVAEIADQVVVMYQGRVAEQGPVGRIFASPRHAYSQMLIGSVLRLERPAEGRAAPRTAAGGPDAAPLLEVRGLSKEFRSAKGIFSRRHHILRAVDDVSFDLHQGETLGIVGESGSGKTTLGRCIIRLRDPSRGTIGYRRADGAAVDLARLDRRDLKAVYREMRMIFQDPFGSLNPRMTVAQIVGEPLRNHGLARGRALEERVATLLLQVGLRPEHMERYPHAFSGGQRQRISIARALALEPRLIIADEATSALDVSLRAQILDLLIELQPRFDLAFLFISHDISVVRYFCDRVAVMYRGRIVEIGETRRVCDSPEHPYTRALLSAVPRPDPGARRMHLRHRYAGAAG